MRNTREVLWRRARAFAHGRVAACALMAVAAVPAPAATIAVTSNLDDDTEDSACTLREAITAANADVAYHGCTAGSGPDRILFSLATPATIALTEDLPLVMNTLLIRGPGADLLTIDGQDQFSLVRGFSGASARFWMGVEDVTLANGLAVAGYGGAIEIPTRVDALVRRVALTSNHAIESGGGLYATGIDAPATIVEVQGCWFQGNDAKRGGALGGDGDQLELRVNRSAFYENTATGDSGFGGAIYALRATTIVTSSTISGNEAADFGGGVHFATDTGGAGELDVHDSTLTLNVSDSDQDGTGGGAISVTSIVGESPATVALENTIVAGNLDLGVPAEPDVAIAAGPATVTATFDLIGSNAGAAGYFTAGSPNPDGSYVGTSASPIDPRLDPLALYGAVLPSHRPSVAPLSAAIDAGHCPDVVGDQRGFGNAVDHVRVVDIGAVPNAANSDGCDIGAHERNGAAGADVALFTDGFDYGHTLVWATEAP